MSITIASLLSPDKSPDKERKKEWMNNRMDRIEWHSARPVYRQVVWYWKMITKQASIIQQGNQGGHNLPIHTSSVNQICRFWSFLNVTVTHRQYWVNIILWNCKLMTECDTGQDEWMAYWGVWRLLTIAVMMCRTQWI